MIDIHFHCLPAVDDGADGLEEALTMCHRAWEDGCQAVIATPHQGHARWPNTEPAALETLATTLRQRLAGRPDVHLGGEVRIGSELLAELDDPRRAGFLPLAGSRYLLLEFARGQPLGRPEELLHELRIAGWWPIIAHPEFCPELAEDPHRVGRLVDSGAHLQVTAMSLTGEFGRRIHEVVSGWIEAGLVHFVASDAHDIRRRPPGLSAARRLIAARWGEELARRLTVDHPDAVVRDQPLDSLRAAGLVATRA